MAIFFLLLLASLVAIVVAAASSPGYNLDSDIVKRSPDFRSQSEPEYVHDLELLNIVLVASVDGKFHALNRTSGQTLWSMTSDLRPSNTSALPSVLAPLVRTSHVDYDPDADDAHQEQYIIEPQTGDIYIMPTPSSPLERFPFSMSELVDLSPFSFQDEGGRRVFVGRKETSLVLLELETGRVKATIDSECPWDPFDHLQDVEDESAFDEQTGRRRLIPKSTDVFVGRTDYHISIYTQPLRGSGLHPPIQNLSFSIYGPNNQDTPLQATYRRTKDNAYIQSLPNGNIISFTAGTESTSRGNPLWAHAFQEPIVAIFDVLRRPQYAASPFVLLQPQPGLQSFLPSLRLDASTLPNYDSAYVGLVEMTGSLFAMSPSHYPMVAFGGLERPQVPLIEAGDGSGGGHERADLDHASFDERCAFQHFDRRCLVGVRRLQGGDGDGPESRMRRLLDGPSADFIPPVQDVEQVNESSTKDPIDDSLRFHSDRRLEHVLSLPKRVWQAVIVASTIGFVTFWLVFKRSADPAGAKSGRIVLVAQGDATDSGVIGSVTVTDIGIPEAGPAADLVPKIGRSSEAILSAQPAEDPQLRPLTPAIDCAAPADDEDSDKEELHATPGKKKVRRGNRGKKKKKTTTLAAEEQKEAAPEPAPEPFIDSPSSTALATGVPSVAPTPNLVLSASAPATALPPEQSLIVSDTILGFGSHGTVVYQGSLQGRAVAVKRLLKDFVTLASREVSILQESDDHPNVIRYYYQETHANFLYIALELCPASLADIVENPDKEQFREISNAFEPKRALRQITSGLRYLHALKLVHRDIKPQNILISSAKSTMANGRAGYRMLISDFGLCKKLDVDQTSFQPTAYGAMAAGTVGWRAPEILRGEVKLDDVVNDDHSTSSSSRGSTATVNGTSSSTTANKPTRLTKSVDIFALGCVFYYTLTNGGHPFGERYEREVNILKDEKSLVGMEQFGEEGSEAVSLISAMLDSEASQRLLTMNSPDTTKCLLHPFFWDPGRRLNFLQDASDRFEIMCRDPRDPLLDILETSAQDIVGNDWHSRLDKGFIETLGKFRKYDGKSVQDLLRALRNKKHHYQDLPDHVKRSLGPMPEGFLAYFTRRYPRLFLHVHGVVESTVLRTESVFRSYFELNDP
ncbi:hypothetical protein FISHEDRAFT_58034 [Fistulina hepatica ATCC 64428]|uniref:non-specific serine/threonine protein kinase n=1 Tax=Fistulina hepatica ATCC 64428 TaxID=1128425 RepID=A0A0D7AF70_9AGAR|nr:hypothetical protein FISHEDRAFT_58034 [Fistulina hepatica ATCC 64428]